VGGWLDGLDDSVVAGNPAIFRTFPVPKTGGFASPLHSGFALELGAQ